MENILHLRNFLRGNTHTKCFFPILVPCQIGKAMAAHTSAFFESRDDPIQLRFFPIQVPAKLGSDVVISKHNTQGDPL